MTKVLMIEDETTLREEIVELLTFDGYEAFGAEEGQTGIASALDDHPDVILCDVSMPGLDGYAVLRELRANPATAAIPFIFMSARAGHNDIDEGMKVGANGYLTKPFYHKDLIGAIEACIANK